MLLCCACLSSAFFWCSSTTTGTGISRLLAFFCSTFAISFLFVSFTDDSKEDEDEDDTEDNESEVALSSFNTRLKPFDVFEATSFSTTTTIGDVIRVLDSKEALSCKYFLFSRCHSARINSS